MGRQIHKKFKTNTLWIFCEGPTEKRYFQNLKAEERLRLEIRPRVSGNTAKKIVDEALKIKSDPEFDSGRDIILRF